MGTAIRRMTSAPVPLLHSTGSRPISIVITVITLGRIRLAAPSTIASSRSASVRSSPARRRGPRAVLAGGVFHRRRAEPLRIVVERLGVAQRDVVAGAAVDDLRHDAAAD